MGVIDEETKEGTIYLYDGQYGSTTSSHVISILDLYLKNHISEPKRNLYLTFDNCGVNKNRWLVGYLWYLVDVGLFDHITWGFPVAGHTKFGPDTMFGWFSSYIHQFDLYEVEDIVERANHHLTPKSYVAHLVEANELLNWKGFIDPAITEVSGITKMHQLEVFKDGRHTIIRSKEWSKDEWKEITINKTKFGDIDNLVQLPKVPLSDKKLRDLICLEAFVPNKYLSYAHP
jgi:hypothetical protein